MKRWKAVVLLFVLVGLAVTPVRASPWTTGGGGPERTGLVEDPVGVLDTNKVTELEMGQSASQPIVVGDHIYHLAADGLKKISLQWDGSKWKATYSTVVRSNHNPNNENEIKVSSSTPTYSPSGWIYWGTAYGQVWAYDTNSGQRVPAKLDIGCPVVSSPLVLRPYGEDVVIVGQKPVDGACNEDGKVYAIWGWDQPGGPWISKDLIHGWATPSPVPDSTDPSQFIMGSDGAACPGGGNGVARKYRIERLPNGSYTLLPKAWGKTNPCVPNGVAGSFAVAEGYAFWVDTTGRLTARRLADGAKLPGWPDDHINLAAALGGTAFTNTKPAIAASTTNGKLEGTAFVTLRNYTGPGGLGRPDKLRGCPDGSRWEDDPDYKCPGAPGALLAVDLATGTVTPYFQPTGAQYDVWLAANTDPLLLTVPNLVLFGDANGTIWGRPLAPGQGDTAAALADGFRSDLTLLHPGEEPMRGGASWSQVSGAGVDPAAGDGPGGTTWLLMGVNYLPPQGQESIAWQKGRLTLIPFTPTFNLKWAGALTAQPQTPWTISAPIHITGTVTLEKTTQTLGQLRPDPPGARVTWYVVPETWDGKTPEKAIPLGPSPNLPPTMRTGETFTVQTTITPTPDFPKKGRLIGVIDAETLAHDTTRVQGRTAATLLKTPSTWPKPKIPEIAGPGLTDNFIALPYELASIDLAVTALHILPEIPCQDDEAQATVTWVVANRSTQALQEIPVRLRADGETLWHGELAELAPGKTRTLTTPITLSCDPTHLIQVEVNPDRTIDEAGQYPNNSREQTVTVRAAVGAGGDGRSVLGNP